MAKQPFIAHLKDSPANTTSDCFLALIQAHVAFEEDEQQPIFCHAMDVISVGNVHFENPKHHKDAMSRVDAVEWTKAEQAEIQGLIERNCFRYVDCPNGTKPLQTTMVYKYKLNADGTLNVRKCRLCVRGDQQTDGIDFFKHQTFSSVLNCRENRTLLSLAASEGWHIFQSDITQAFTYGSLNGVDIFCYPPPGVPCPPGKVLKLERAVYGLKQAPAAFKACLTAFFRKQGFTPANDAETICVKRVGKAVLIHGMFVDDILHCTNDKTLYHEFRKAFEKEFKIKSQDHVNLFLGIQVQSDRAKGTVSMNQSHHIDSCLEKFGLSSAKEVSKPITDRLSKTDQPATVDSAAQERYRGIVGSLLYLANWTRVDIAFAVSELSRFVANPGAAHMVAAQRVFRYLKKTKNFSLNFSRPSDLNSLERPNVLWGYVDSDWAGCPDSRRSTSGYVLMLNGAAVSWRSKRQSTVALSTAEAEFVAASSLVQEVIYLRKLLTNMGFPQTEPTVIFEDNECCVAWSEGSVGGSERAKHIDLRKHFVHDAVQAKILKLQKIDSKNNAADLLTKALDQDLVATHRKHCMGL